MKELAEQLADADGIQRKGLVLSFLMRFKQICNHPSQWLGDGAWSEDDSGKWARLRDIAEVIAAKQEKMLVFTQFREVTAPLAAFLGSVFGRPGLVLHGETEVKKRKELVRRFQEDEAVGFFVLSLKAGGAGLNLTAASHVVHFDRWWNPAVENQATDRAFRIGQTKNVLVHKFVCRGTVEEKIDQLIESKRQLSTGLAGRRRRPAADRDERRGVAQAGCARHQQGAEGDVIDGLLRMETLCFRGGAAAQGRARDGEAQEERATPSRRWSSKAAPSPRPSGARPGARTSSATATYANRLPRGRTYVRNGSVVDLQITPGEIKALVSGSEIYEVAVKVAPVAKARWKSICEDCAGAIDSLVELLQGRFSKGVMERICRQKTGLFPVARRDQALVQLPGLGRYVQACRGGALRHRRAVRPPARTPLPVARRGREGTHRRGRKGASPGQEGAGCQQGPRRRRPFRSLWIGHGSRHWRRWRVAWRHNRGAEACETANRPRGPRQCRVERARSAHRAAPENAGNSQLRPRDPVARKRNDAREVQKLDRAETQNIGAPGPKGVKTKLIPDSRATRVILFPDLKSLASPRSAAAARDLGPLSPNEAPRIVR